MNTFSAFRFAAATLLRPHSARFHCLNLLSLQPRIQVRFTSKTAVAHPRNEEIPFTEVSLVVEDNKLFKTSLKRLLKSINHKNEYIELVSSKPEPVVKIINKKEALVRVKKVKERRREVGRQNIVKEVQLTWGSEQSDLEHKLARARTYLEVGAKVDIVYTTKSKTVPPAVKVMQQKVQDTITMLADVSTEWKPVEWRRNMAAIFLKGIVDPNRKLTTEQVQLTKEGEEGVEADEDDAATDGDVPTEKNNESITADTKSPPQLSHSQPVEPGKPKDYVDLSAFGYAAPLRRNPLKGMKAVKRYGSRRANASLGPGEQ